MIGLQIAEVALAAIAVLGLGLVVYQIRQADGHAERQRGDARRRAAQDRTNALKDRLDSREAYEAMVDASDVLRFCRRAQDRMAAFNSLRHGGGHASRPVMGSSMREQRLRRVMVYLVLNLLEEIADCYHKDLLDPVAAEDAFSEIVLLYRSDWRWLICELQRLDAGRGIPEDRRRYSQKSSVSRRSGPERSAHPDAPRCRWSYPQLR